MWPLLLDMTEEESVQSLRHLELEAYSSLVSALRAQGSLSSEKRKLLKETSILLSISSERHKAEVRRAISDERLNTIAYHITGQLTSLEDWAQEGRRLIPLLPRVPPQTSYSVIADEASETAAQYNRQLPLPVNTERKRPSTPQTVSPTQLLAEPGGKPQIFRVPEVPKEEPKKRRSQSVSENSSLAQHLLAPKLSKIQQIYRQVSKASKQKQIESVPEKEISDHGKSINLNSQQPQHVSTPFTYNNPKINIIQNISIPGPKEEMGSSEANLTKEIPSNPGTVTANENQAPTSKHLNIKSNSFFSGHSAANPFSGEMDQAIDASKLSITKKQINKGQKLIVVSNAQTLPTNSILQKTLSVPMNKLTKFNLEKFKIVPNNQLPSTLQVPNVMNHQHISSPKPKMVTIKGNSGKKVIPLSQLQMLNPKGSLKVVPYSGKMLDKNIALSNVPSDNIKRTMVPVNYTNLEDITQTTNVCAQVLPTEKVKVEYNGISENGEKAIHNYDMKIAEFQISRPNCNDMELDSNETLSTESSEASDMASNEDFNVDNMVEIENCEVMESHQNEILEEFEVIHSEELLQ